MAAHAVALLDVNVLVALVDADHVHHTLAHDWFADEGHRGWATCPLTENGFVRVLATPAYGSPLSRPVELLEHFRKLTRVAGHVFWPADISLANDRLFNASVIRGHRQVTDAYLLGLAVKMNGRLATFDHSIPTRSVIGATARHLAVIGPGTVD